MVTEQEEMTAASAGLTMQIVNPLAEAVRDTFMLMLGSEVTRDGFGLRPPNPRLYEYSALLQMNGPVFGAFCLSLSSSVAVSAVSRVSGNDVEPGSELLVDGVGEFTNVIVGAAKDKLDLPLEIEIPEVIAGPRSDVEFPAGSKPMRIMFGSDLGPLLIDFGFVQPKAG